jgi:NADPH-dependent curcumin reductase CurA
MSDVLVSREIHLASRPVGEPTAENFTLVERPVVPPGNKEVLVRNRFLSVDPYMRGRMNDVKSYAPPFQVGEVMDGGAVGEVIASNSPDLAVGDWVLHNLGWREYAVLSSRSVRKVDPTVVSSPSAYLGILGMVGLTAYVGLLDIAGFQPGDTVFVSGAAGAVGSLVGQFARLRGAARVIGSAGSDDKVTHLTDKLGFDAAFNYKSGRVVDSLRDAAPDGLDVYFDNVGGDHLEAALSVLNLYGRVAVCGMISQYNATEPPAGPRNLALVVTKRLTMRGFLVSDHSDRMGAFLAEVADWVRDGKVTMPETVIDGIENAPTAFLGLLSGRNIGKMLVRLPANY